ncbi:MAG: sigma-70 family RNA polymerase sigma factor [Myxococcales bacterium]
MFRKKSGGGKFADHTTEQHKDVRAAIGVVMRRLIGAKNPEYEDLVQSAHENVLTTFQQGTFRGGCPPAAWAGVIARNVAINAIRNRMRERRLFSDGDVTASALVDKQKTGPELWPERLTEIRIRLLKVQSALRGLGAKKSNVVFLHDVLGYQLNEVANILGTSVAAAQSRLVRGRKEIVERVDTRLYETAPSRLQRKKSDFA